MGSSIKAIPEKGIKDALNSESKTDRNNLYLVFLSRHVQHVLEGNYERLDYCSSIEFLKK